MESLNIFLPPYSQELRTRTGVGGRQPAHGRGPSPFVAGRRVVPPVKVSGVPFTSFPTCVNRHRPVYGKIFFSGLFFSARRFEKPVNQPVPQGRMPDEDPDWLLPRFTGPVPCREYPVSPGIVPAGGCRPALPVRTGHTRQPSSRLRPSRFSSVPQDLSETRIR